MPRSVYLGLLAFVAALGGFLFGFDTAVISGTLSFVRHQFAMSPAWEGWFVSSAILGCIFGVSFAGRLSDKVGRKKVMLLAAIFFFISGIGCALASDLSILITFRFIGGLGVGVASIICPMYISEFAPARIRGSLVTLYQLAITIGILSAYFSNAILLKLSLTILPRHPFLYWIISREVWRGMFGMYVVPAAVFFILLLLIPESPRWLIVKGQTVRALRYLARVNGMKNAETELELIRAAALEEPGKLKMLLAPAYRTALIIGLLLPLLSQFSGINAVIYYGPRILEQAGFRLGDALGGQVTIGIVNVIFTFVAIFTIDRWGRKPLLMWGIAGAGISLVMCGLLFAMKVTSGPWILFFILAYTACFSFSFGPVCWVILGEIYPNSIRGRAMSLATLSLWLGCFFVGQLTPVMLEGIGASGTFWIFAVLCVPAFLITWKMIPETKEKSLEEIERFWTSRRKNTK